MVSEPRDVFPGQITFVIAAVAGSFALFISARDLLSAPYVYEWLMWGGLGLGFFSIFVLAVIGLFTPKGAAIGPKKITGVANLFGFASIGLLFVFIALNAWNETVRLPKIVRLRATPIAVLPGAYVDLQVDAVQPNGDDMNYSWSLDGAAVAGTRSELQLKAPSKPGFHKVAVAVHDGLEIVEDSLQIEVLAGGSGHPSTPTPEPQPQGSP